MPTSAVRCLPHFSHGTSLHLLCLSACQAYSGFKGLIGDFVGGPVVKTPHFHCRGHGVDPWGTKISQTACCSQNSSNNNKKRVYWGCLNGFGTSTPAETFGVWRVSHQSALLPSFALLPVILVQVVAPAGGAPFFKQMFIVNNEVYGHF